MAPGEPSDVSAQASQPRQKIGPEALPRSNVLDIRILAAAKAAASSTRPGSCHQAADDK